MNLRVRGLLSCTGSCNITLFAVLPLCVPVYLTVYTGAAQNS